MIIRCGWRICRRLHQALSQALRQAQGDGEGARGRRVNAAQGGLFDETTSHSTKTRKRASRWYEEGEA